MTDPWDEKVYLPINEWLIFMLNAGKYTSPMDAMGIATLPDMVDFDVDQC